MRPLIYRRNSIAYPGGRNPAFDPTHIAASPKVRYSGIAAPGGAFTNLLNGTSSTQVGAPTSVINSLGLTTATPSTTGVNVCNNVANAFTGAITGFTSAAILSYSSVGASGLLSIFDDNAANGNLFVYQNSAGHFLALLSSGTSTYSVIQLAANTPYFVAVSANSSVGVFVVVNLLTGAIQTATVTQAIGFFTPSSTWNIGGQSVSTGRGGSRIAAIMYSVATLSLQQLLAWAQNPWDFWYPPTALDLIQSSLQTPPPPDVFAIGGQSLLFI